MYNISEKGIDYIESYKLGLEMNDPETYIYRDELEQYIGELETELARYKNFVSVVIEIVNRK